MSAVVVDEVDQEIERVEIVRVDTAVVMLVKAVRRAALVRPAIMLLLSVVDSDVAVVLLLSSR